MPKRYRLYIDESGDHTYKHLGDISRRCLGLTGIVFETDYYRTTLQPTFEQLKQRHFPHSPDEPIVLVRTEMLNRRGPFTALQDPARRAAWGNDFMAFVSTSTYVIMSVVIDKLAHFQRYVAPFHPYHYCLNVLLERYIGFLRYAPGVGDVLAESRGGQEDMALKQTYQEIYHHGTMYHKPREFQQFLTSNEIKLKKKQENLAGLQLADLLAAPAKIDILTGRAPALCPPCGSYTRRLIAAFAPKWNPYGRVFLG